MKSYIVIGALLAALAVILGAFGAHGLKEILQVREMAVYQTAVQYHFFHALGLILISISGIQSPWSARLMLLGIALFSGSLYLLVLTGFTKLGIITPFGGTAFIIAWLLFAWGAWKKPTQATA
jgi:uncharacterized membrane protein YgdD (TMEM256/DUF423 family)